MRLLVLVFVLFLCSSCEDNCDYQVNRLELPTPEMKLQAYKVCKNSEIDWMSN